MTNGNRPTSRTVGTSGAEVCKLCGLHKDAVPDPGACSAREFFGNHEWSGSPDPQQKDNTPDLLPPWREHFRRAVTAIGVFTLAFALLAVGWQRIKSAGASGLAAILALIEWVVSWPSWVWICLAILYAARRVARAIEKKQG